MPAAHRARVAAAPTPKEVHACGWSSLGASLSPVVGGGGGPRAAPARLAGCGLRVFCFLSFNGSTSVVPSPGRVSEEEPQELGPLLSRLQSVLLAASWTGSLGPDAQAGLCVSSKGTRPLLQDDLSRCSEGRGPGACSHLMLPSARLGGVLGPRTFGWERPLLASGALPPPLA